MQSVASVSLLFSSRRVEVAATQQPRFGMFRISSSCLTAALLPPSWRALRSATERHSNGVTDRMRTVAGC